MSLRQIRKLRARLGAGKEAVEAMADGGHPGDDSEHDVVPVNAFDALGGNHSDDGAGDAPKPLGTEKKKKQKKKKKAAGEGKTAGGQDLDEIDLALKELGIEAGTKGSASGAPSAAASAGRKEVPTAATSELSSGAPTQPPYFCVDPHMLDADAELRRMFGKAVIKGEKPGEGQAAQQAPRYAIRRPGFGRRVSVLRLVALTPHRLAARTPGAGSVKQARRLLVEPRASWPPVGMFAAPSMEWVGTQDDGTRLFRVTHSVAYETGLELFDQCASTHNPDAIAALLQDSPYIVPALLQMAEIAKHGNDFTAAADLTERALFALQSSFHPQFDIRSGLARLDDSEENMDFLLAVFRYIQLLARRGLHRTALEFCKLLYALRPDDPLGVLLVLDYHALKAGQETLLLTLCRDLMRTGPLLPNLAFSQALAMHRMESRRTKAKQDDSTEHSEERSGDDDDDDDDERGSDEDRTRAKGKAKGKGKAKAKMERPAASAASGKLAKAKPASEAAAAAAASADSQPPLEAAQCMQMAILTYPMAIAPLLNKCGANMTARDAAGTWEKLLEEPLFQIPASGPLQRLIDVFVERHFSLWKAPDVLHWLKTQCAAAVASLRADPTQADTFALVRDSALASPSLYHHIALSDFNDSIAQIPAEELQGVAGRFMLPDARLMAPAPPRGRGAVRLMRAAGGGRVGGAAAAAQGGRDEAAAMAAAAADAVAGAARRQMPDNPLAAFLWTLLPWNAGRY